MCSWLGFLYCSMGVFFSLPFYKEFSLALSPFRLYQTRFMVFLIVLCESYNITAVSCKINRSMMAKVVHLP